MLVPGKCPRQLDHVGQLRVEHPGIQRQPQRRQLRQPGAELRPRVQPRRHVGRAVADDRIGVPATRVAHAAEPPAAGADMRLQHRLDPVALGQVGVTDDAGGHARLAVAAAVAHRGDAGDELGLAHRPHLARAAGAIHRVALQEHAADNVVAGGAIVEELVQQVARGGHLPRIAGARHARAVPQVMVRIDDRQLGVEDLLRRRLGEPFRPRRRDASILRDGLAHWRLLPRLRLAGLAHVGAGGSIPRSSPLFPHHCERSEAISARSDPREIASPRSQ